MDVFVFFTMTHKRYVYIIYILYNMYLYMHENTYKVFLVFPCIFCVFFSNVFVYVFLLRLYRHYKNKW